MRPMMLMAIACTLASCADVSREDVLARATIEQLRTGDLVALQRQIDPIAKASVADLEKLRTTIGAEPTRSLERISFNAMMSKDRKDVQLQYEMGLDHARWFVFIAMRTTSGATRVIGIHLRSAPSDEAPFSLRQAGPLQIYALGLAALVVLFTAATLVVCARSPIRRKWLWMLFVACSFGTVAINWSTGQFAVRAFAVHVLGAGLNRAPGGPWVLELGFPLGALIFLWRRSSLMNSYKAQKPPST